MDFVERLQRPPTKPTTNSYVSTETFKTDYGKMTCFKNDIVFYSHLFNGKVYEEGLINNSIVPTLNGLDGEKVILDIGAHIGSHSIIYSTRINNCKVIAFEAQRRIFQLLEKNMNDNNIKNCFVNNKAVGHVVTQTTLSNMLYDGYDCEIEYDTEKRLNYGGIGLGKNGETVNMITIDSLDLDRCDYMKMDVEGAEILVLMGAKQTIEKFMPIIWFEKCDKTVSEEMKTSLKIDFEIPEITDYLKGFGYRLIQIDEHNMLAFHDNSPRAMIDISHKELTVHSESGEDGILFELFNIFGVSNRFYVEFGAEDGTQCNTRALKEMAAFKGVLFDMNRENEDINLYKHTVTTENIIELFRQYNVPEEFDLLSVDIDSHDFYVLHEVLKVYRPRFFICEYNATHLADEDKVVLRSATEFSGNYFGASILAYYNLARKYGYSLVYANNKGVNLFFVKDDVLVNSIYSIKDINNVAAIYKTPKYGKGPNGGHPADPLNQEYVTSDEAMA